MSPNFSKIVGLLLALCLAGPPLAWAGEEGWLTVSSPRSGQAILSLPADQVKSLTLVVHHSYDQRPVAESFVIKKGQLVPTLVVFDSDTYDLRRSRYPGAAVRSLGGKAMVYIKRTRPQDRLAAIKGRVAHGTPQVLLIKTASGSRRLSLAALGPGGTPYFIGVLPRPLPTGKRR